MDGRFPVLVDEQRGYKMSGRRVQVCWTRVEW